MWKVTIGKKIQNFFLLVFGLECFNSQKKAKKKFRKFLAQKKGSKKKGSRGFFFEKRFPSVFSIYNPLTVYAISDKSVESFTRTSGHGQTFSGLSSTVASLP